MFGCSARRARNAQTRRRIALLCNRAAADPPYERSAHRDLKKTFAAEEDLEEAIRMARYDSFLVGPEMAAGKRVIKLREKKRVTDNGGPPLTRAEEVSLRFLGLLYPPPRRSIDERTVTEHPFWDLPAEVERPRERGPVCADLEDFEEFADVPPFVIGNPNYPPEERGADFSDSTEKS